MTATSSTGSPIASSTSRTGRCGRTRAAGRRTHGSPPDGWFPVARAAGTPRDMTKAPDDPTDLPKRSWFQTLKRTFREFKEDNLTDWAAALTYYGVLSLFPALIVLVSVLGLIGSSATQPLIDNLGSVAPGPAKDIFTSAIKNLQGSSGASGVFFIIGLAAAIWSASGYVSAFMRASNAIYDMEEGRPIWKTLPVRVGLTLVLLVLLAVTTIAVVLTGGLAEKVGDLIGLGSTAVTVWNIAKWPVLVLVVSFMFALLYWAAPNVKQPGFHWVPPGGDLGRAGAARRVGGGGHGCSWRL